jgi:hypothetical protein
MLEKKPQQLGIVRSWRRLAKRRLGVGEEVVETHKENVGVKLTGPVTLWAWAIVSGVVIISLGGTKAAYVASRQSMMAGNAVLLALGSVLLKITRWET